MGIGDKPCLIQLKTPLFIQVRRIYTHAQDLGQKHMVAPQLLHLCHPALDIHRAFQDNRSQL